MSMKEYVREIEYVCIYVGGCLFVFMSVVVFL